MVSTKRLGISTLLGLVAGILCWLGGTTVGISLTGGMVAGAILSRVFIGFVIGISGLQWNYLVHGALIGLMGSLPIASGLPDTRGLVLFLVFGALWGLLIELLTTKVFKAPMGQTS